MAIQTATNIRVPRRANWRTFDPINAADYETIIEGSHTLYQRLGQTVPGLYGDFRTTSTTYTTTTSTSDRNLDTWEGGSRMFRDLESGGGSTKLTVRFISWIKDCRARLSVTRRDSDGTETLLDRIVAENGSTTLSQETEKLTLSEAKASESGSASNDRAVIVYTVDFLHLEVGAEAQMTAWHVDEFYDSTGLLP